MTTKKIIKTMQKKTQSLERSMASFFLFRSIIKNKRAVSAVISNLILIGAVLAIGLVALAYARSTAINYQTDYAQTMSTDIGKLKESLVFEYAHYGSNQLSVFVLNSGPVNVTVKSVSINDSPVPSTAYTIHRMSDNQPISNTIGVIGKGVEVRIDVVTTGLTHSNENNIKITSRSDSNFAYNFLV